MRNPAAQSDPNRNRNFSRRWKFHRNDRQYDYLSPLEAQAQRDEEARRRLHIPLAAQSAAIFAGGGA